MIDAAPDSVNTTYAIGSEEQMRALLPIGLLMIGCGGGVTPDETPLPADSGPETGSDAAQEPTDCTGTQPATMVTLPEGYSIDSTEVTRCQYKVWLDTNPSTSGQDPWCAWNTDFAPTGVWPLKDDGNLPVGFIDWCDAYAYCRGVGKRLCGKTGGGSNDFADFADETKSQWYNACSSGGKLAYPYGDAYDLGAKCNDADRDLNPETREYLPVGSLPQCQSVVHGYAGVYDLSGNTWEWEDSCDRSTSQLDLCRIRGGSVASPETYASCGHAAAAQRGDSQGIAGIRCCSP